jgi:hypothetical protein
VVATLAVQAKNSPHKTSSAARRYIRGQASEERRQAAGPDDPLSPELKRLIDLFFVAWKFPNRGRTRSIYCDFGEIAFNRDVEEALAPGDLGV